MAPYQLCILVSIFSSGSHFFGTKLFRQFGREHDEINFSYFCRGSSSDTCYQIILNSDNQMKRFFKVFITLLGQAPWHLAGSHIFCLKIKFV